MGREQDERHVRSSERETGATLILTGSTASGKKEVGLRLAREMDLDVVFMDSVKVYRGMRIGAAAPGDQETHGVRTYLLGIADPRRPFSLGQYLREARAALEDIRGRGRRPLFLGGTALYLQGLLRGFFDGPPADPRIRARLAREAEARGSGHLHARLCDVDPDAASRIHRNDLKRIVRALEVHELTGEPLSRLQATQTRPVIQGEVRAVAIRCSEALAKKRQRERVERMIAEGLIDEVKQLRKKGILVGEAARAIGYREILAYLEEGVTLAEAKELIVAHTARLDRRQGRWLRRIPQLRWVERTETTLTSDLEREVANWFLRPGPILDPRTGDWFADRAGG